MESLLEAILKQGPEWLGWGVAVAAIILHFKSTQRTIDIAERNTEAQKEMASVQLERAVKDAQLAVTLEKVLTLINERLPSKGNV